MKKERFTKTKFVSILNKQVDGRTTKELARDKEFSDAVI